MAFTVVDFVNPVSEEKAANQKEDSGLILWLQRCHCL